MKKIIVLIIIWGITLSVITSFFYLAFATDFIFMCKTWWGTMLIMLAVLLVLVTPSFALYLSKTKKSKFAIFSVIARLFKKRTGMNKAIATAPECYN